MVYSSSAVLKSHSVNIKFLQKINNPTFGKQLVSTGMQAYR